MNEITIFQNPEFGQIRTMILPNGQVGFVGKDVAMVLGYNNPAKAIRDHVDNEDKGTERIVHPLRGAQNTIVINESGLTLLSSLLNCQRRVSSSIG